MPYGYNKICHKKPAKVVLKSPVVKIPFHLEALSRLKDSKKVVSITLFSSYMPIRIGKAKLGIKLYIN